MCPEKGTELETGAEAPGAPETAQPEEREAQGGSLQFPNRTVESPGGQALLPGKKEQDQKKWPQVALEEV